MGADAVEPDAEFGRKPDALVGFLRDVAEADARGRSL